MLNAKLKKLADRIYCLEFDNAYDLSMTFLRCQEFYESPKFRNKFFTISEFMSWYSKKFGNGDFTYPTDYVGFNLPSRVIIEVMSKLKVEKYDAWTEYDQLMYTIWGQIVAELPYNTPNFYLIGVMKPKNDKQTLQHEIGHALYTVNPEYQKEMDAALKDLSAPVRKTMNQKLKGRGYASNVWADESQTYFATGLHASMKTQALITARAAFKRIFKKYTKEIL